MTRLAALLGLALLCAARSADAEPSATAVASYRIEATWDGERKALVGRETVTFVNRTSRDVPDVLLHLRLNGFRDTRSALRRGLPPPSGPGDRGGCELKRVALSGGADLLRSVSYGPPEGGEADDRTLARVPLPVPVPPGGTLVLEADFESRLPRGRLGTGWTNDFVLAGQWFPLLARATEVGWTAGPLRDLAPTPSDFGDYDVTLLLPAEVKGRVATTGRVVEEADAGSGQVRVRARAREVRDFAFAFSPRFEPRRETVAPEGLPKVEVLLFLQPDHRRSRARYLRAAREGLAHFGKRLGPYPYPTLTIVDPPSGSGAAATSWPTLLAGSTGWLSPASAVEVETLVLRLLARQWLGGVVATDGGDAGPLDEGLATWVARRAAVRLFGPERPVLQAFGVPIALDALERPLPEDGVPDVPESSSGGPWDSRRTPLLLESVARTAGERPLLAALGEYVRRFAFRDATTRDLLDVVGEVAGAETRGLLERGWRSAGEVDHAVTRAVTVRNVLPPAERAVADSGRTLRAPSAPGASWDSTVVVRRRGEPAWPVEVELRFDGGHVVKRRWDGGGAEVRYRATGPRLVSAVVDPHRVCLLDRNRLNDGLFTEPDPTAARSWGHRLRFLAQSLLELFALLAALPGAAR